MALENIEVMSLLFINYELKASLTNYELKTNPKLYLSTSRYLKILPCQQIFNVITKNFIVKETFVIVHINQ